MTLRGQQNVMWSYAAFNKYARVAASQSVIKTIMHAVSSAHTCTYGHVYLSSGRINICTCKNTHSHTHSYPDSNILDISDGKSSLPHCRHWNTLAENVAVFSSIPVANESRDLRRHVHTAAKYGCYSSEFRTHFGYLQEWQLQLTSELMPKNVMFLALSHQNFITVGLFMYKRFTSAIWYVYANSK